MIFRVGFKHLLYSAIYSYSVIHLYVASLHDHAIVASGMYYLVFIKTENIVVNEIGKIYMYTSASTRSYIFLYDVSP